MNQSKKEINKIIFLAFLKLIIAGIFIGVLKSYDLIIAILLAIKLSYNIYKQNKNTNMVVYVTGLLLTGFAGVIGEHWGVSNGYWEYHHIPRELPFWLPFAWMLAFDFLYRLEKSIIQLMNPISQSKKIVLAIILALIFPAFGEVITIYLGVWTYYWPYQILGVPLYAFICLVFVHMMVYLVLHNICKFKKIEDIVFN